MCITLLKDSKLLLRNYASLFKLHRLFTTQQFQVSPFCNVNIEGAMDLQIKPLDVFEYQNCDVLIVESIPEDNIMCDQNKNTINITCNNHPNTICNITAPVKANFNINFAKNVKISNFNSDKINIMATGDIDIHKCQGETISVQTKHGKIISHGVLQAANISLESSIGSITTGRLQGRKLRIKTTNGDIKTDSTYCDESTFETENGNINLDNAHKNVDVTIKNEGNLNIVGFDGTLSTNVKKGDVNIQLSRIISDSNLTVHESGDVTLKLADSCQESTSLEIAAKECSLVDEIDMNLNKLDDRFYVTSRQNVDNTNKFTLDCKNSAVKIGAANWSEMFRLKFKGRNENN